MKTKELVIVIVILLVVFDAFVWYEIVFHSPTKNTELYFLDVGQGDSELVILPGNIKILIDGGPDNKALEELSKILPATDRYIDLVVMSHPQTDHFTGLISVLSRYRVGAFLTSGNRGPAKSYADLEKAIAKNKVPVVVLSEGDNIAHGEDRFDILSPDPYLLTSAEPNDWVLVMKLFSNGVRALYNGDIDSKIEDALIKKYDMALDVLKVAHHGSRFSSDETFLNAARPKISVIEVGAKNTYGHPTKQTLDNLASIGSQIFRTDRDGMIKLEVADGRINIFKEK